MNCFHSDWYQRGRKKSEQELLKNRDKINSRESFVSPSGRFRIESTEVEGGFLVDVFSSYHLIGNLLVLDDGVRFNFGWAENHADGGDYLVSSTDLYSLTVIELNSGKRADYVPAEAENGEPFIHTAFFPSPDKSYLAVDGCVWGASYENIFYRFSEPMNLPWPIQLRPHLISDDSGAWDSPTSFTFELGTEGWIDDMRTVREMTKEEESLFMQKYEELGGEIFVRTRIHMDGRIESLDRRVVPYNRSSKEGSTP